MRSSRTLPVMGWVLRPPPAPFWGRGGRGCGTPHPNFFEWASQGSSPSLPAKRATHTILVGAGLAPPPPGGRTKKKTALPPSQPWQRSMMASFRPRMAKRASSATARLGPGGMKCRFLKRQGQCPGRGKGQAQYQGRIEAKLVWCLSKTFSGV